MVRFYSFLFRKKNNYLLKKIKIRRLFAISNLILLLTGNGLSQKPQLAGASYIFYPNSGLKDDTRNAEFTFQEFGGFIKIPYKFKNGKTAKDHFYRWRKTKRK